MKFTTTVLIASLLVALTSSVPTQTEEAATRYIIKLKAGASQDILKGIFAKTQFANTNKLQYTYSPKFFNGFAGSFTSAFLSEVRAKYGKDLAYIEKDGIMKALGSTDQQANPPSWGQRRVSTRALDLNSPYIYPSSAGRNVNVFVVDTGVQFDQEDFKGRAKLDKSFVVGETVPDANGHGTHCSGTIGSATYGLAKNVNIRGVKVLNGAGSGTFADVIAGIQYVATQVGKEGRINTVMSMSLGGPKTQSVDDAVNSAVDAGVVAIIAAGNNAGDACQVSPAGAAKAFAVGATDNTDTRATFSNFGKCVKIFAPGVNILSLWKGASGSTNTISGTSMATPHVAGIAAIYLADKKYATVQEVYADLVSASTKNVVKNPGVGSPSNLLFSQNIAA